MKLHYRNKNSKINLIIGIFWFIWFWVGVFTLERTNWYDWGWLIISVLYILTYFSQKRNQYATITDQIIKLNDPIFGKKIKTEDVKTVRKFAGDYIFKTDHKELSINTQIITPESLKDLDQKIEELGIPWS